MCRIGLILLLVLLALTACETKTSGDSARPGATKPWSATAEPSAARPTTKAAPEETSSETTIEQFGNLELPANLLERPSRPTVSVSSLLPSKGPKKLAPNTEISLRKSACRGRCPVYRVSVDATGKVSFIGEEYVARFGVQETTADPDLVGRIVQKARDVSFFEMDDEWLAETCKTRSTDGSTSVLAIRTGKQERKVAHESGCSDPRRDGLRELIQAIEVAAVPHEWLEPSLTIEGAMRRVGAVVATLHGDEFGGLPRNDGYVGEGSGYGGPDRAVVLQAYVDRPDPVQRKLRERVAQLKNARESNVDGVLVHRGYDPKERRAVAVFSPNSFLVVSIQTGPVSGPKALDPLIREVEPERLAGLPGSEPD